MHLNNLNAPVLNVLRNWDKSNLEKCSLQLYNILLSFLLSDNITIEIEMCVCVCLHSIFITVGVTFGL